MGIWFRRLVRAPCHYAAVRTWWHRERETRTGSEKHHAQFSDHWSERSLLGHAETNGTGRGATRMVGRHTGTQARRHPGTQAPRHAADCAL